MSRVTDLNRYGHCVALMAVVAVGTIACGQSTPTQPSSTQPASTQPEPASPSPGSQVFHDTLNPATSRDATRVWPSAWVLEGGRLSSGSLIADDFVARQSGQIRTVRWQGGYCDGRFNVPHAPPAPSATLFYVSFVNDMPWGPENFDLPPSTAPERYFAIAAEQVQHLRLFDLVPNANDPCVSKGAAAIGYYEHSVVLPTPVTVVSGRRYWLEVSANIGTSPTTWGWRVGLPDNGRANTNYQSTTGQDMAFRLTN
jgi:hypothetical protein